jgi:outer membrane receptor protein involved in Fe transport
MKRHYLIISLIYFLGTFPNIVVAQEKDSLTKNDLIRMSLEELLELDLKIGTHTPSTISDLPVSVTRIEKGDIEVTPARNILDLIEVYVPGATFVNHWLGPRIGIRGVSGDQNTSYLLLVNGINANMKTLNGPFFEIQNRDLNDIECIEIIRGPGSVTYGHGAIGGIINIKTLPKNFSEKPETGIKINTNYRYGNVYAKWGFKRNDFSLGLYGSLNRSLGEKTPHFFYIDRAHGYGYGFMGKQWGNKGLGTPAPNFYGDFRNIPQKKAQIDVRYKNSLQLYLRYTDVSFIKQQQKTTTADGPEFPGLIGRMFMSALEFSPELFEHLSMKNKIAFHSQSNRDVFFYRGSSAPGDHITQRNYSFSENELFFESIINFDFKDHLNIALGGDLRHLWLGPEWGMKKHEFIHSFPPPLRFAVYDTLHSGFYQQYGGMGIVNYIDKTISAGQFSIFAEGNIRLAPFLSVILSGRFDKHEFSKVAFSPRIALISTINEQHTAKIIAQKAVRLPTFNELYTFNMFEEGMVDPEKKEGIECMYNYKFLKDFYLDFSLFYNSIEQIAWTPQAYPDVVGTFGLIGTEIGIKYLSQDTKAGLNYAFIDQTEWDPVDPIDAYLTNIGPDSVKISLNNYGRNRINNLPGHSLKFFITHSFSKRVNIHANGRLNWKYGQIDMLDSFKEVHDNYGTEVTKSEMDDIYDVLMKYGYSKPSFTTNLSLTYHPDFLPWSKISLNAMNLLKFNHFRYVFQYWEEGNNRQYPRHVGFVTEPASVSLKWVLKF